MDMCKEAGMNIFETIIDRAHRLGNTYVDIKSKKRCKSIIVRFTSFCHRTMSIGKRKI